MANLCKGGCGKELPAKNKSGFAYGHSNGCPTEPPPSTSEAISVDETPEPEAVETVECHINEHQLDAIWSRLAPPFKAAAILHALDCE